jgi:hypothetical protein
MTKKERTTCSPDAPDDTSSPTGEHVSNSSPGETWTDFPTTTTASQPSSSETARILTAEEIERLRAEIRTAQACFATHQQDVEQQKNRLRRETAILEAQQVALVGQEARVKECKDQVRARENGPAREANAHLNKLQDRLAGHYLTLLCCWYKRCRADHPLPPDWWEMADSDLGTIAVVVSPDYQPTQCPYLQLFLKARWETEPEESRFTLLLDLYRPPSRAPTLTEEEVEQVMGSVFPMLPVPVRQELKADEVPLGRWRMFKWDILVTEDGPQFRGPAPIPNRPLKSD